MYPNLSYLIKDLFGFTPPGIFNVFQTFGFFMALAFIFSAWLLKIELRRKEQQGLIHGIQESQIIGEAPKLLDFIPNAIIGFILGFKIGYIIPNWSTFINDAPALLLSKEGNILGGLIGAALLIGLRYWEKKKAQLPSPKTVKQMVMPHERIGDIVILAAISGIIGAKLFTIIEDLPAFFQDPFGMLFSGQGLTVYGGYIAGFFTVRYYLRKKQIKVIHVIDAAAPALMLAYGIGRIGCQLSGDGDWGIVNMAPQPELLAFLPEWMWAFDFPHNVNDTGVLIKDCVGKYCHKLPQPVYPTAFYETMIAFVITGILWLLRKRLKVAGTLFFTYLIFNGIERFCIETIRVNDRYNVLGFNPSQAQIIAIGLVLVGISGVIYLNTRKGKTAKNS